eukprot:GGOE01020929.1.p1 GENE.GGOE01020929.1~~GGOE01020929.1.p1  ORF type:complete len:864 (-),score=233.07 GGOE01020929.1:458-3007(-)
MADDSNDDAPHSPASSRIESQCSWSPNWPLGQPVFLTPTPGKPAAATIRLGGCASSCGRSYQNASPKFTCPSWWACARMEAAAVAVPLVALLAAAGCWFAVDELTATCWYAALYTVLALVMLLLMFLHFALSTQQLLQRTGHDLVTVLAAEEEEALESLAPDVRVRFLQLAVLADFLYSQVPRDPLDFVQDELQALPTGPVGYIVINTTGIILWVNSGLLDYFGYTADELLQQNIRVLMPKPYSVQHDHFVRKCLDTGHCRILGRSREVPVLDKAGSQSVVMLRVDDRTDPTDLNNRLFLGRMDFSSEVLEVPAIRTVRSTLQAGSLPVEEALKVLADIAPESVVAINAQGIILFANDSAYNLFQWPHGALFGQNVSVLMAEPFASAHDGFLQAYQQRAVVAQYQGASWPTSSMVGSGRDVMAKAKSGQRVRVFLMVTRMDRPSGRPQDCVFVAKMVHIGSDDGGSMPASHMVSGDDVTRGNGPVPRTVSGDDMSSRGGCTSMERCASLRFGAGSPRASRPLSLGPFAQSRYTVVALELTGLDDESDRVLHQGFAAILGLVFTQCSNHHGVPHWVVGPQMFVAFNVASLPNPRHRTSAAAFMLQLTHAFARTPLAERCTLRLVAVSLDAFCGQWGSHHLLSGNPLDHTGALLHAQKKSRVANPVIDNMLYEELKYNYVCRLVNRVLLPDDGVGPRAVEVYELLSLHEAMADQWMYELPESDVSLSPWGEAWTYLPANVETPLSPLQPHASPSEACRLIQCHLSDNPADPTALWLLDLLQQWSLRPLPLVYQRQCGPLTYRLQFDSVLRATSTADDTPLPPATSTNCPASHTSQTRASAVLLFDPLVRTA